MERKHTLEQLTGELKRSGIDPDGYGERIGETNAQLVARAIEQYDIAVAVEQDKRKNWPRIEKARAAQKRYTQWKRERRERDTERKAQHQTKAGA